MTNSSTSPVYDAAARERDRQTRIQLARSDVSTFLEYVIRDESTGQPIELQPFHEEWMKLLDDEPRLVLHSSIESGKSQLITVGRLLFELGRDPSLRCAIVSNTASQAKKFLASVSRYIERSTELREVFPGLLPDEPWGSEAITVRRSMISKDASAAAIGATGPILGARLDRIFIDDILDFENTRTPAQRSTLVQWVKATLLGRLTANGRIVVAGSAWHPDDLLHVLIADDWPSRRFSIEDDEGRSRWPARWPKERIASKRAELGKLEAARQLDCLARNDATSRFAEGSIEAALLRGKDRQLLASTLSLPEGAATVVGVDLAVGQSDRHDRTAITTVVVHAGGHRELIAIESGRWQAPEIIKRIRSANDRFRPRKILVESNASQMFITQMLKGLGGDIPVRPFTTGRGKQSLQYAAEMLAVEFERGQWTLRGFHDSEVAALVKDMLFYSPAAHCGDRLASLLFARHAAVELSQRVTWFDNNFTRR